VLLDRAVLDLDHGVGLGTSDLDVPERAMAILLNGLCTCGSKEPFIPEPLDHAAAHLQTTFVAYRFQRDPLGLLDHPSRKVDITPEEVAISCRPFDRRAILPMQPTIDDP